MKGRSQGISSKNLTNRPVRTGVGARGVNKNWPAQVGISRGTHLTDRKNELPFNSKIRANPYEGPSFKPAKLGNEVAASTKCGVGGSRTLYGQSGSQQQYGKSNPGANDRPSTKGQWPDSRR